jgi:hypothetical protein
MALPGYWSAVDGDFVYDDEGQFLDVYLASGFVFVLPRNLEISISDAWE